MIARCTQPNLAVRAERTGRAQLLEIPYSHFCELAKWSCRDINLPHDIHSFAPGAHILPTLALRVGSSSGERYISRSSSMMSSTKGSPTSVPALVLPDGTVLKDSWSIVDFAFSKNSINHDPQLRDILDKELGPLSRTFVYSLLFKPENRSIWDGLVTDVSGWIFATAWKIGVGSFMTSRMIGMMKLHDPEMVSKNESDLHACFQKIQSLCLGDEDKFCNGRSEPSVDDYCLAALAAPAVLPPEYAQGEFTERFEALLEQDASARRVVEGFRSTNVGRHCLHMYKTYRFKSKSKL